MLRKRIVDGQTNGPTALRRNIIQSICAFWYWIQIKTIPKYFNNCPLSTWKWFTYQIFLCSVIFSKVIGERRCKAKDRTEPDFITLLFSMRIMESLRMRHTYRNRCGGQSDRHRFTLFLSPPPNTVRLPLKNVFIVQKVDHLTWSYSDNIVTMVTSPWNFLIFMAD